MNFQKSIKAQQFRKFARFLVLLFFVEIKGITQDILREEEGVIDDKRLIPQLIVAVEKNPATAQNYRHQKHHVPKCDKVGKCKANNFSSLNRCLASVIGAYGYFVICPCADD